ncbi:MAG TPA: glutamate synthase subunit beta [Promineifilum sp.]|nr:glutamate synthase subunit beta [Promineifilum sp.]HRQ12004.1 glutamate synthase subunit beta [Promineifilum sp.]
MSKITGFMTFAREAPGERPIDERVRDWRPIHIHLPEERLHSQAARCMDCGTPFCHKGQVLNGMTTGCPVNNLIPEWNDLIYRGLWRQAYDRLRKTNNFPEFTGLVCPAPCEAACTLGIGDSPVTIKSIEFAIIERAYEEGWVTPAIPMRRTGKRVAVIGSGPAGLACAEQLNSVGHEVTVFERADRPGGLLMYGIPNMKLDKKLVQRRIEVMRAGGIRFVTGVEIGVDMAAADIEREFDAVVLCTGATRPRDLSVPGRRLGGVHFAMDFLHANTRSLLDSGDPGRCDHGDGRYLSAAGKDVIVVGGGDTGTDCVATALRHGCRSLVQFEIMPQPPEVRAHDNPWPQWPRIYKTDYGQAEAAAVFGGDPRAFCVQTVELLGDEDGCLRSLRTADVAWRVNGDGRPAPHALPGTAREWPAQMVILALGFLGPEGDLPHSFGAALDGRANIAAPYGRFQTNAPHVFAAGDARRGQSLVVWAIHEGRAAAREVDRWLMGETDLP